MSKRVIQYRRKRKGRTDYKTRLSLLKSGLVRLVIRKSNKSVVAQLVEYDADGDKVVATARASDLKKLGWKAAAGNLPAAYLTGILLANKVKKKINGDIIVDIGLQTHHKGSRVYAVAKGAKEAGLKVRIGEESLPPDERAQGQHINETMPKQVADMKIKLMK
ncbi:MAG: 50S ribosomal protein L18 [Candidatus Woesearchaeota archaeon]|nr:50S ribosomal protein L18 [Candidatus Woesearchaeota archaeon]